MFLCSGSGNMLAAMQSGLRRWLSGLIILLCVTIVLVLARSTHADQPRQSAATRTAVGSELVSVQPGTLAIVLTAPHGGTKPVPGATTRRGTGVERFVTVRDANTSELAEKIADALERELGARPAVVIARFQRTYIDANRKPEEAYEGDVTRPHYDAFHAETQRAVDEAVKRWGRALLIDVHGQSAEPDAIFRGTLNGRSVTSLRERFGDDAVIGPDSLFAQFQSRGYRIIPEPADGKLGEETRFSGGYITQAYGSHAQPLVDAIQIEVGLNFRRDATLDKTADDIAQSIAHFARKYLPAKPVEQR